MFQVQRAPNNTVFLTETTLSGVSQRLLALEEARALARNLMVAIATPNDPVPFPLPPSPAGMLGIKNPPMQLGVAPEGGNLSVWIPGICWINFELDAATCALVGQHFTQTAQLAASTPTPTPQ